jgi:hypothetical protein
MKQYFGLYLTVVILVTGVAACSGDEGVPPAPPEYAGEILYTFAPDAPTTDAYTLTLNGKPCYIYPAQTADVATFGVDGHILVAITPKTPVASVKIRPESAGITPEVKGNVITFILSKPQYLSVEINDELERPLLLFADAPETDAPDKNDPSVLYFEAGKIYEKQGCISLTDKKTVYVAPGAIVHGALKADRKNDVCIRGRGILSGKDFTKYQYRMVELINLKNAEVEGITIVDSHHWTVNLVVCTNVDVHNVKIVNEAPVDDGIDVVGSRDVRVDHCFIRTADDCVAIKAGIDGYFDGASGTGKDVVNVSVKNSVFWTPNPESNIFEIGYETETDTIKNIYYENNDIIHLPGKLYSKKGAFAIHNSGRAVVDHIVYKNIRIEDAAMQLMHFEVLFDPTYSKSSVRGKVLHVYLENIAVSAKGDISAIMRSHSETSNVQTVSIKNMTVNGRKITRSEELHLNNSDFMPTIIIE